MLIEGLASNEKRDLDNQIIKPSGFITDYFLKKWFLNFNHATQYSADSIIGGEPIAAKTTKDNDFFIKGRLYNWSNLAKSVYRIAENLEKDEKSNRTLGFSIEGLALETENDIVSKILITGCAIAPTPKNSDSYLKICKGVTLEGIKEIRKGILLQPLFSETNEGNQRDFVFDLSVKDKRILVDSDFNFEIRDCYPKFNSSIELQKAIITLSKAVQEGLVKKDKLEELRKIIRSQKLN